MFCRWCGRDSVRDGFLYCPDCGRDVTDCAPPAAAATGGQTVCKACGTSYKNNYLYCAACGLGLEVPAAGEPIGETIARAAPQFKSPTALAGLGRGNWLGAACGAGIAALVGVALSMLFTYIIGNATYDPYSGMSIQLSPWAVWVSTHLPSLYLGVAAQYQGFTISANASFSIPFLLLLSVPLLSLWVGGLLSNRGLDRNDWAGRTGQALRMAAVYAALLFIISLGTGFDMANALPLGLMSRDLSSLGFGIVLKFQWLSVLLYGLLWAVAFGLLVSAGRRGVGRLVGHYAGRWAPALSGIGSALAVSIIGGVVVTLTIFFTLVVHDIGFGAADVLPLYILVIPNLVIYGLGIGAGAPLQVTSNIPGEEMYFTLAMFGPYAFSHWTLYLFGLLVAGALLWGGYQAARRGGRMAFWQTGLAVGVGYGVLVGMLTLIAQFKADIDMGDLSQLMYFFGGEGGRLSFFAGTGFWATLIGLSVIGVIAASCGAIIGGRNRRGD